MKVRDLFLGMGCLVALGSCLAGLDILHNNSQANAVAQLEYDNQQKESKYVTLLNDYEGMIAENNQLNVLLFMADRSRGHVPMMELEEIYDKTYEAAAKYGLDGAMVLAVFGKESDYIKEATSSPWDGRKDRGLGQVSPDTLKAYNRANGTHYNEWDLYDIDVITDVSAWYLADLKNRPFITDDLGVFTSYNRGPGTYRKHRKPNDYAYEVAELQDKISLLAKL